MSRDKQKFTPPRVTHAAICYPCSTKFLRVLFCTKPLKVSCNFLRVVYNDLMQDLDEYFGKSLKVSGSGIHSPSNSKFLRQLNSTSSCSLPLGTLVDPIGDVCGRLEQNWHEGWDCRELLVAAYVNSISYDDICSHCSWGFVTWWSDNIRC